MRLDAKKRMVTIAVAFVVAVSCFVTMKIVSNENRLNRVKSMLGFGEMPANVNLQSSQH